MILPSYVTRPIAALLLELTEPAVDELAATGRLTRRRSGQRSYFAVAELSRIRGEPISLADMEFAETMHRRRLASYQRINEKRQQGHASAG
jgi:hypothetical protein